MLGHRPGGWLTGSDVTLNDREFVLTGTDLGAGFRRLDTSNSGVFAVAASQNVAGAITLDPRREHEDVRGGAA